MVAATGEDKGKPLAGPHCGAFAALNGAAPQNSYKLTVDAAVPERLLWHPKFKKFDCCSSMSRSLSGIRCPLPP
jgi:hypothetical protein